MAWGCAKVAQRAKKRFRKLHTHEVQAYRKESRGPLVRPSIGVVLECVHNEVGVFLALLLKYLLWKSDYGSKSSCTLEHTLRSLSDTKKTDVSLFQRYHCFLTIQGTRARAGHAPGTMGHLLTYLEPRLVSSSHLGVCYSQSVLSWMVSFFFFFVFLSILEPGVKGYVGHRSHHEGERVTMASKGKQTSLILQKHSLQLKLIESSLLFIAADLNM